MKVYIMSLFVSILMFGIVSCAAPSCSKSLTSLECEVFSDSLQMHTTELSSDRGEYWESHSKILVPILSFTYLIWNVNTYDWRSDKNQPPIIHQFGGLSAGIGTLLGIIWWGNDVKSEIYGKRIANDKARIEILEMCMSEGIRLEECK